ncbi:hypothetical protein DFH08DRAFT_807460 [Mycena albidolilacea]|uniref:DUF6534 domain-containing protein n=1 Tax=Mycena albidolilacea TaxID=1033008 RepID=A0AAD7A4I4_9AGAR|nr:hypothetical protein DFH08DRAFT_807460 [Mycena albidolilacea]
MDEDFRQQPNFFPTFFATGSRLDADPTILRLENQVAHKILVDSHFRCNSRYNVSQCVPLLFISYSAKVIIFAAGGVWTAVMVRLVKTFANKPKLHNPALLWFLSSCVTDALITISLVVTLLKRKTGFSGTDSVIDKINRRAHTFKYDRGLKLTQLCSDHPNWHDNVGAIYFLFHSGLHYAVNFIWDLTLSKLYTNCLMSTLNARQGLNGQSASAGLSDQRRNNSHGVVANQTSARAPRHPDDFVETSRHMDSSAMYELDTQKSTYDVESGFVPAREEYGIQVTKVVECVKDPIPHQCTQ